MTTIKNDRVLERTKRNNLTFYIVNRGVKGYNYIIQVHVI